MKIINYCYNDIYYIYHFANNLYNELKKKYEIQIYHINCNTVLNRHASMIELVDDEGLITIFDFGDPVPFINEILNEDNLKNLYTTQYHLYSKFNDKVKKFTYMEKHWGGVKNKPFDIENTIPKMVFIGSMIPQREVLNHIPVDYIDVLIIGVLNGLSFEQYIQTMSKYRLGFSPAGGSDISLRDCECYGLGLPTIRKKQEVQLLEPLIENFHYISYEGDINNLIKRFKEVVNDIEFLKFISYNAKCWYNENLNENIIKKIIHTYENNS